VTIQLLKKVRQVFRKFRPSSCAILVEGFPFAVVRSNATLMLFEKARVVNVNLNIVGQDSDVEIVLTAKLPNPQSLSSHPTALLNELLETVRSEPGT
jgi:hypothetical protein